MYVCMYVCMSVLTVPPGLASFQDTIIALSLSCPTIRTWNFFFNASVSKEITEMSFLHGFSAYLREDLATFSV